jgi:membrane-bound metal-dependent hydrolase YbcI (DUF457 family)
MRGFFSPIMEDLKSKEEITLRSISIGALLGTFSHILLDAPIYAEMNPFFPFIGNPFFIGSSLTSSQMEIFCIYCFLAALLIYFIRREIEKSRSKQADLKI